jgi:uncharacterized membrane protein YeaQ/YmgE (transglycosylase-associated protein family)
LLWFIVTFLVVGLIAGFMARTLVPGEDPLSVGATTVLGVSGSLVGGFLGYLLFGKDASDGAFRVSGLLGSIVGAVIAFGAWRYRQSRASGRAALR